jgi:hypothetical protein
MCYSSCESQYGSAGYNHPLADLYAYKILFKILDTKIIDCICKLEQNN